MADKIAAGAWNEGPSPASDRPDPKEVERLTARRASARWTAIVGVGMMFLASLSASLAIGGAAMALAGGATSFWWGRKLRKLKGDPWAYDPELDGPR